MLGKTEIQSAFLNCDPLALNKLLLSGMDINSKYTQGKTVLMLAVETGQESLIDELLAISGINVNAQDNYKRTALIFAAKDGNYNIVKKLLSTAEIDVNIKTKNCYTALMYAEAKRHFQVSKELRPLTNEFFSPKDAEKALIFAILKGHTNIVKKMLSVPGLSLNNNSNYTVLDIAAFKGDIVIITALMKSMKRSYYEVINAKNRRFLDLASDKVLKYILYSGTYNASCILWGYCNESNVVSKIESSTSRIKEDLQIVLNLSRESSKISFPHRLRFLTLSVCGLLFSCNDICAHTGMSMPKFRSVVSLMRSSVLTMLSYGFNAYMFMYMLMLRSVKGSLFSHWSFDLRVYFLEFITNDNLVVTRKDFFAIKLETSLSVKKSEESLCEDNTLKCAVT